MMNRAALFLLIVFSFALVSCGGESEKHASKKGEEGVAEKILEKTIKSSSGKVDVNVTDETIHIKTQDGNVTIAGGKNVNLPASFPEDIPIYKGAKIIHSMEANQEKAVNVSLTTDDDQATVAQYYKSTMGSQGWEEKGLMELPTQKVLMYGKGKRSANLVIAEGDGQTQIIITTGEEE